jgi:hypothetical protein
MAIRICILQGIIWRQEGKTAKAKKAKKKQKARKKTAVGFQLT